MTKPAPLSDMLIPTHLYSYYSLSEEESAAACAVPPSPGDPNFLRVELPPGAHSANIYRGKPCAR